ncbi:EF-hand domain-containing protein [Consotaella aegiceratis]|uniref:EF-hand domain-containing protein n=1 Tax=Consotaella aegiceratis TaxID=3097961 RepID=UPI002F3E2803
MRKTIIWTSLALTFALGGVAAGQGQAPAAPTAGPAARPIGWHHDYRVRDRDQRGRFERDGRFGRHGGRGGHGRHGPGMANQLQTFDRNGDGTITQAEIDQARQDQIGQYDADKNGALSLDEYQTLWSAQRRERMVDAFQAYDADGDGQVTPDEFNGRFAGMIARFDRNGDGQLSQDDFSWPGVLPAKPAPSQPGGNAAPQTTPGTPPTSGSNL